MKRGKAAPPTNQPKPMDFDSVSQIPPKSGPPKTIDELVEFAEDKLEEYGIADQFEVVVSSRMKRAIGRAEHSGTSPFIDGVKDGKLKLSGPWFRKVGMDRMIEAGVSEDFGKDIVLHELAHCIDFIERNGESGHGRKWKQTARRVGADPTRTCDVPRDLVKLIASWKRVCPNCEEVTNYYYSKPHAKKSRACKSCCNKYNGGNFSYKYELEVKRNDEQTIG